MSLEEVILTTVYREKKPIRAYRRLLESNVPKASHTSPGSAEIASSADRYWKAHLKGERLPYFSPFDVSELNIVANITGTDFVIYRQTGRRDSKVRPLVVVADTRLFSLNREAEKTEVVHVVISNEGARKLSTYGLRRVRVVQMLPNVSTPGAAVFETPIDLARRLKTDLTEAEETALKDITFLDLRSSMSLLDKFSKTIGRRIRLFAVNCTSRFKRTEAETSNIAMRRIRTQMVEQRSTVICEGQTVELCLQARTAEDGWKAEAVWNLESEACGPGKAGKDKMIPAVEGAKLVSEARAEALKNEEKNEKKKKSKKEKKRKDREAPMNRAGPQIRRDPCCSLDPQFSCEACKQMTEEFEEMKKPPILSSLFMYNPQKNTGGSFVAEARSLGLCAIFPWLEDAVFRSDLMSCSAMDLETLNVPVGVGSTSGIKSSLTAPGEVGGGTTVVTRHVPFVIGTTSFKTRHVAKRSANDLLWRLQREAGKYVEFRVPVGTTGVPGQTDVATMVHAWLEYVERRRRIITQVRRKMFARVRVMLKGMARRSRKHLKKLEEEELKEAADNGEPPPAEKRAPSFAFTVYGRLLTKLKRMCESINIVTYNGAKFDIINILAHILSWAKIHKQPIAISRKGEPPKKYRSGATALISYHFRHGDSIPQGGQDRVLRSLQAQHRGQFAKAGRHAEHLLAHPQRAGEGVLHPVHLLHGHERAAVARRAADGRRVLELDERGVEHDHRGGAQRDREGGGRHQLVARV